MAGLYQPARRSRAVPSGRHAGTAGDDANFVFSQDFGAGVVHISIWRNDIGAFDDPPGRHQRGRACQEREYKYNQDDALHDVLPPKLQTLKYSLNFKVWYKCISLTTVKDDLNQKVPLSRDRWLELALETLSMKGKSKFSLDALIKAMPVSKGSFYWHFKDRAEFLMALVERWDRHETQAVIDALEAMPEGTSAEDRLWELMCFVYESKLSRYDLLIRSMTLEFPEVRKAVEIVDKKRIETVKSLFAAMGFSGDELAMRTLVFVTATSLDHQIFSGLSQEDYERQLRLRHKFFVGRQ